MGTLKLRLDPNGYQSKKTGKMAIYLEYNHRDERKLFSTKEKCLPEQWSEDSERIIFTGKNLELSKINVKIGDLKSKIDKIIFDAEIGGIEPSVEYVVTKLNIEKNLKEREFDKEKEKLELNKNSDVKTKKDFIEKLKESEEFDDFDKEDPEDIEDFKESMTEFYLHVRQFRKFQKKKRSKNTYRNTKVALRFLKEFDKKRKLNFDLMNFKFFSDFETWLADKGQSDNTVWTYLKITKAFINHTFNKGIHHNLDHKKFQLTYHDPVVVSPTVEEIMKLYSHKFKSSLYEKIKKLYICNSFIGARFEDFIHFGKENFKDDGIYYFQSKNEDAEQVFVPYYSITREILEEFNYKIPVISNQKFNDYLHELLKECKLFDRVVEVKEFYHGKMTRKLLPLHEALSSHSCRKFFCTLHANSKEINMIQAMSLSGHKREKHFKRYVVVEKKPLEAGINSIDLRLKQA